jgi:hypothetical protein
MSRFVLNALIRGLNWCMRISLPANRRDWGRALIAEQQHIRDDRDRLAWAAGGLLMSAREFIRNLFEGGSAWAAGGALSLAAALIDLRSTTRWPYSISMCLIAFVLTSWRPRWVWRWTLLVALTLPTFVLLSNRWGPYSVDRFDVFFGLVPATLGTSIAVAWRRLRYGANTASH